MIELTKLSRAEALRYLGGSRVELNEKMEALLDDCERELLLEAKAKYLYKKISLENSPLIVGEDIKKHLAGCGEAFVLCATLGAGVDRLIRTASVEDMAMAVVLDALASVAVEQLCSKLENVIAAENEGRFFTWRFSPGYGDYPLSLQEDFLRILDAPRKIGLCTNENSILTPGKSVTAIMGVSEKPLEKRRTGCQSCNLAASCKFRKVGTRCEF